MTIFTILTCAMLILVVVTGLTSLTQELGIRWGRLRPRGRGQRAATRPMLRHRA